MPVFKEYILNTSPYRGGSTRRETIGINAPYLIKMSSNENPLGPSPLALAAIQRNLNQIGEYHYESDRVFAEKLSKFFRGELSREQFLPANSGMELLDLICRAFLEPGTSCILSSPTFMAYKSFAEVCGARVIDVPLIKGCFALDVYNIIAAIDETTRLIFIANPNNPTGSFIPRMEMDELIDHLPEHVVLVYDEAYYQYVERPDYPRAKDYVGKGKNLIGLHSFSKAYGLAGLRLGYIFSTPRIMDYLRKLRRPFMIGSLAMEAGMAALDDGAHLSRTLILNNTEKYWLYDRLSGLDVKYWPSEANFILIQPDTEAEVFTANLLNQGIMVRTTGVMGAPSCVRVTVGTRTMNEAFIEAVREILTAKPSITTASTTTASS